MNILITGANGFIGKNLKVQLDELNHNVMSFDLGTDDCLLEKYCSDADFVFHLAGINRPLDENEYMTGNRGFTYELLDKMKQANNKCPILFSSSIQAELSNPYGISKKEAEALLFEYSDITGAKVLIYRLNNVFGKWGKPDYNSVIATFCHNIARGLPIMVHNPETVLNLVYIDDVVGEFLSALVGNENQVGDYCYVPQKYTVKMGELAEKLISFSKQRSNLMLPNLKDSFTKKLHSTFVSYLPDDEFNYLLDMKSDKRGSFTEFIRTDESGQFSVNISYPGVIKGNHYHNTKTEKFLVVHGNGIIRFRKIGESKIIEYGVSGDNLQVVDIPPGFTHNIENVGKTDLITVMWVNQPYDPENPDTYFAEV